MMVWGATAMSTGVCRTCDESRCSVHVIPVFYCRLAHQKETFGGLIKRSARSRLSLGRMPLQQEGSGVRSQREKYVEHNTSVRLYHKIHSFCRLLFTVRNIFLEFIRTEFGVEVEM